MHWGYINMFVSTLLNHKNDWIWIWISQRPLQSTIWDKGPFSTGIYFWHNVKNVNNRKQLYCFASKVPKEDHHRFHSHHKASSQKTSTNINAKVWLQFLLISESNFKRHTALINRVILASHDESLFTGILQISLWLSGSHLFFI